MKKLFIVFVLLFLNYSLLFAQNVSNEQDETAIKQTALNYAEGFYSGDAVRMEKAIHPDFNKAVPAKLTQTGRILMNYSTYTQLIELTRAKVGLLDESKRKLTVSVLNINDEVANAKVLSSQFNDYLQMIKIENEWKIVNVLWTYGSESPNRIKDFNPETEKDAIKSAAVNYIEGSLSGDAKLLEIAIHPEFSKLSFNKNQQTGKISFIRRWSSFAIENALAKIGYISEPKRDYQIRIIDIMDGLAVVEIMMPRNFEYLQMFKDGNTWKVFHSLVKPNPNISFLSEIPILVNRQMPDFTLPIYGGEEFTLSKFRGKNVMLVFPRGWIGNGWCTICFYQYAELVDYVKNLKVNKKYDLEIVYILPYSSEKIKDWENKFPQAMLAIERWKNPPGQNITQSQKEFADLSKEYYPKKYEAVKEPFPVPILIDAERKISKKFHLFSTLWDGIKAEQNIPTIFIVDKKGIVQFKYHSQTTFDRPNMEYLIKFIKNMD